MSQSKQDFILETRNLTKAFKGFTAVDDVNLKVQRGNIHALIGPNGAGKTTVFNLLTKFLQPTTGQILFNGDDITSMKPAAIARKGVIRSFQISAVFPHLSVMENVRVALQRKEGNSFHFWRSEKVLDRLNDRAVELLESVGLEGFADTVTVDLPYGRKRALEIATTLALEPELMLLDEPTQGMGHEDVDVVTDLIKKVSQERTILMVEHNLHVVSKLADQITVLQRGAILTEGNYETVSNDPQVREAYMGTAADEVEAENAKKAEEVSA
ncbi:ABC transporter ATP-binding protein [Neptuniibacter caesariensis]|uniref:ABC transporter related n=1 Tax=Neptuniibacter caesariensis TaxID=207954 RepID=A0A7U8GSU3_NEPCE|nr:ABC transporter ATP-binding protein [Neptuniibacter caesariensis]EAR61597.1 ABC transporter related [Oceanospirillum sp. MED92] [Neptuniibacter caesariensis]